MRIVLAIATFLLVMSSPLACAQWIQAGGQAIIRDGNIDKAREDARNAALRDAALQFEAQVNSSDTMENGVLTKSSLTVASQARARQVKILSEHREGDVLRLVLLADMQAGGSQCTSSEAAGYRKRVAIAGFSLLHPDQAGMGELDNADRALPKALYQALLKTQSIEPFSIGRVDLLQDVGDAPTRIEADNDVDKTLRIAREFNVQFVVAGVIRDISVEDPHAWGTSIVDRMVRGVGLSDIRRHFVVDMFVYDGYSGSIIDERQIAVSGKWNIDKTTDVGFGTAAFWQTDFGHAVRSAIGQMRDVVTEAIACQPFMTRITRVANNTVYLGAGAGSGIRPGDTFQLYRTYRFQDAPNSMPELQDTHARMQVQQVNPEFSRGVISRNAAELNLQQDDIAVIW